LFDLNFVWRRLWPLVTGSTDGITPDKMFSICDSIGRKSSIQDPLAAPDKTMKLKIPSIIATVIGSLCAAYALLWQYEAMRVVALYPFAAAGMDSRYFWWPLFAAVIFWALACVGFILHRKHRQDHVT